MEPDVVEYAIDANDVITGVNEAWRAFALENSGEELIDGVVGTWLWKHLAGWQVKSLFKILLERVREDQRTVTIPFRCDAPEKRREMMLEVTPAPDWGLRFSSWVEREVGRPALHFLEAGRESDPDHHLTMCAWCKRIDLGREDWAELEDAIGKLELFNSTPLPRVTHGVCRDCKAIVLRDLEVGG
jgi:hypothetical protein